MGQIPIRIKELRRVQASTLKVNPKNWRTHPKEQRRAMEGMLREVGYADALLARELPDGTLELVDGHLRAETTPGQEVPVLVLDLTEEEAAKVLATMDPIAAMAGMDGAVLKELLAGVEFRDDGVKALLRDLEREAIQKSPGRGAVDPDDVPTPPPCQKRSSAIAISLAITFSCAGTPQARLTWTRSSKARRFNS